MPEVPLKRNLDLTVIIYSVEERMTELSEKAVPHLPKQQDILLF